MGNTIIYVMDNEKIHITQKQLDFLLEYYRSVKPATKIELLYDELGIKPSYVHKPKFDYNDLGIYKNFFTGSELKDIKNTELRDYEPNKKEETKLVFNDILNKYLDNHRNSIPELTYDKIARTAGGMSSSKLSNIVNSVIEPERKDVLLICDALEADEQDINRMLISCDHPKLQTLRSAKANQSIEDITMRLMLKCKKDNNIETLISNRGTSLDLYNEISKLPFKK